MQKIWKYIVNNGKMMDQLCLYITLSRESISTVNESHIVNFDEMSSYTQLVTM